MKIGFAGCGQIADIHASFIRSIQKHKIVAVCDEDRRRADAFAQKVGARTACATLSELLERERPDVIHVLTPPQSHATLTLQAIRAGCHVVVEKPMALSVEDADAMIAAADQRGVRLCVNHNQLFEPVVLQARRLIAEGMLGTIVSVESYYGFDLAQAGERRWLTHLPGNVFQNLAPHPLSVMLPFLDDPLELHATALASGGVGTHVPDELRVLMKGGSAVGLLSISLTIKPHLNFLRIYGSKAVMHVDIANQICSMERLRPLPKAVARGLMSVEQGAQLAFGAVRNAFRFVSGRLKPYQGLGNLVCAFYDSLENGDEPPVTCADAKRVVRVFESILSQIRASPVAPEATIQKREKRPTVFVTGASGFLGGHLVGRLNQQGVAVRALIRPTSRIAHLKSLNIECVDGDLSDPERLKRLMNGCDTVYHCAAATSGAWDDYLEATIRGTEHLLDASVAVGVRRFVHLSSLSVYGVNHLADGAVVTEDTPYERHPELRGFYSHSKIEAEKLVLACSQAKGLPTVILRPGTIYGPRGKVFFPRIGYSCKNKVFVVIGRGDNLVPLTYVDNVVEAICLAGAQHHAVGQIYNIVDDDKITQRWYLEQFVQRAAIRAVTLYVPFTVVYVTAHLREMLAGLIDRNAASRSYRYRLVSACKNVTYDASRAKSQLQWKPDISVDEGLRRTFDWYNEGRTLRRTNLKPAQLASDPS